MEPDFPPEFAAACGRHGLGIYVISNDFQSSRQFVCGLLPPLICTMNRGLGFGSTV